MPTKTDKPSVALLSLGCARNLTDAEVAIGALDEAGYDYVDEVDKADVLLINTCGFVEEAKNESIQAILEAEQLKKAGSLKKLVVMGCLSQRYQAELASELKEVDVITGVHSYREIPELLKEVNPRLKNKATSRRTSTHPRFLLSSKDPRHSLTPEHFAYVKISEGCINACSYCAIPRMKGPHRSRSIDDIVQECTRRLTSSKLREINLIGQDVAAYGYDLERKFLLDRLIESLAKSAPNTWFRLLYAHPAHLSFKTIEEIAKFDNVCSYIDLPIEHSHPEMLKAMNRGVTLEHTSKVINRIRRQVPGVAIRTALIVGFPGETKEHFDHLKEYIQEFPFDHLGVFTYSNEEGTRSSKMDKPIPNELKEERRDELMKIQEKIAQQQNESRVGSGMSVLVEDAIDGGYLGRTQSQAPEVDGQTVLETNQKFLIGDIVQSKITDVVGFDLIATPSSQEI